VTARLLLRERERTCGDLLGCRADHSESPLLSNSRAFCSAALQSAPFNKPEVDVSFRSPLLLMIVLV